jgi:hypothetical protein
LVALSLLPHFAPHRTSNILPCDLQATEDELQAFHSDDYTRALKTAHETLSAHPGGGSCKVAELEEFGLFVST